MTTNGAVILGEQPKRAAREIIVAPRLPEIRTDKYASPFDAEGDIVVDCDVPGCGYHAMGPRRRMGLLMREHHRTYHSDQTGVLLLNAPRQ